MASPLLVVRPATKRDAKPITKIADTTLGKNYLSTFHVNISEQVHVAEWDGMVAGFVSTELYPTYHTDDVDVPGLIDTVAVHPDYQCSHIGTVLVGVGTASLILRGATLIECYAWESPEGIHLEKALERNGFDAIRKYDEYWSEEPDTGYRCVVCGYPCHCSAVLFERLINNEAEDI